MKNKFIIKYYRHFGVLIVLFFLFECTSGTKLTMYSKYETVCNKIELFKSRELSVGDFINKDAFVVFVNFDSIPNVKCLNNLEDENIKVRLVKETFFDIGFIKRDADTSLVFLIKKTKDEEKSTEEIYFSVHEYVCNPNNPLDCKSYVIYNYDYGFIEID